MTANIQANPFGTAQLNTRPALNGTPLPRQTIPATSFAAANPLVPPNGSHQSGSVSNAGGPITRPLPDTTQHLVNALGIPTLVSYLNGGRKPTANTPNPFRLDGGASSAYEEEAFFDEEKQQPNPFNTGGLETDASPDPDAGNPFRYALYVSS